MGTDANGYGSATLMVNFMVSESYLNEDIIFKNTLFIYNNGFFSCCSCFKGPSHQGKHSEFPSQVVS